MGKGKGRLVGKGRLADAAILQRKKYYGLAIRRNCSTSVLSIYTSIWAELWPRFGFFTKLLFFNLPSSQVFFGQVLIQYLFIIQYVHSSLLIPFVLFQVK